MGGTENLQIFFITVACRGMSSAYSPTYTIKHVPEDFVVREVSLLPTMHRGRTQDASHTYILLKKKGYTTFDALDQLKRFFALEHSAVQAQGLKDEDGVTEQIVSVKKILTTAHVEAFNDQHVADTFIAIDRVKGYGTDAVSPRALHGNVFTIVVRNVDEGITNTLNDFYRSNRFVTFINYYDKQRFGIAGGPYNTHQIGKAVIDGDWVRAFSEFLKSGNAKSYPTIAEHNPSSATSCQEFFHTIDPHLLSFLVASHNSKLWNRHVSRYLEETNDGVYHTLEHVGEIFLPSYKSFSAESVVCVPCFDYSHETKITTPAKKSRNVSITTTVYPIDCGPDEYHEGKHRITLSFFLPTGCYATMAIRQTIIRACAP
jgi:tRNA pseudouridine13 synthase